MYSDGESFYARLIRKGGKLMGNLIMEIKDYLLNTSLDFSIAPRTDYKKHIPKDAEQLMKKNWTKVGETLSDSIVKVGEEIEKEK